MDDLGIGDDDLKEIEFAGKVAVIEETAEHLVRVFVLAAMSEGDVQHMACQQLTEMLKDVPREAMVPLVMYLLAEVANLRKRSGQIEIKIVGLNLTPEAGTHGHE